MYLWIDHFVSLSSVANGQNKNIHQPAILCDKANVYILVIAEGHLFCREKRENEFYLIKKATGLFLLLLLAVNCSANPF